MNVKDEVLSKITFLINKEQYNAVGRLPIQNYTYAIVKGVVLSKYCYNDYTSRAIGDVDILMERNSVQKLEKELQKHGFMAKHIDGLSPRFKKIFMILSSHQTIQYNKQLTHSRLSVDLNFDIFWGEYEGKRIDIEEFLSDTVEMEIYGVKVKTLTPIKTMIQLVLHHYKDMNSIYLLATRKSIKYGMFKDVYHLLKNNLDAIPLDKLYAMSAEYEIIPYVFYVLYYTGQIFDDDVLQQYIEAFRTPEGEALLNCYGLCAKERKEWKYDFKTRLDADNLYELIKNDLTEKDKEKISINKRIFMGVSE